MAAIATLIYAAAGFTYVLLVNNDAGNESVAAVIWLAASLVAGFAVGRLRVGRLPLPILPLVAVLFAVPFGYADVYLGSDSPLVWPATGVIAALTILGLLLGVGGRRFVGRTAPE